MSFSVRLTRGGLRHESNRDGETVVSVHRPSTVPELLRFWHYDLEAIDEDVTLGDLLSLLREVEGVGDLSAMLSCAVEEFLDEAALPAVEGRTEDIEFLEVYNTAWLDGYDPEGRSRYGSRGRFVPPYRITRDFHGWGRWPDDTGDGADGAMLAGGLAIEFTPVNELVHLPLRYNAKVVFSTDAHGGDVLLDTELTVDFGEFVHAILWEIGFFGSPGDRNEQRGALDGAVEDIEMGLTDLIPMEDLMAELGIDPQDILPDEEAE